MDSSRGWQAEQPGLETECRIGFSPAISSAGNSPGAGLCYICDRIKALLLWDNGWSFKQISEALLLDEKTIRRYRRLYEDYGLDRLLNDEAMKLNTAIVACSMF